MQRHLLIAFVLIAAIAACGKKEEATPPPAAESAPPATTEPAPVAAPPEVAPPQVTPEPAAVAEEQPAAPGATDALALARKSGCLACHSIEKKVVGPAWKDVATRYRGDANAKQQLVEKVKKGGKGNWTDLTGGAPMPPYSPRVSDADIETLVDFVLKL